MMPRTVTVLVVAASGAACDSSSQCPHDAAKTIACVLTTAACSPSTECDHSLECGSVDPQTSCFSDADRAPQCRPAAFDRLALQDGFGVSGMQVSLAPGRSPQVVWQSPHDAEVVSCALFLCNPSFVQTGCSPTGDRERRTIANFDQCVLLFRAAPAEQAVFALIDENASHEAPYCNGLAIGRHIVTKLAAGCWAYDTTRVIAASELVPVSGNVVAGLTMIPHDTPCVADGDGCYDGTTDRFGVCFAGTCTVACRTSADCALAGDPAPPSACDWTCREIPPYPLGACVHH